MSMNAIIAGVVKHLRSKSGLGLDDRMCDEQLDGQPPPNAGQLYYGVHSGSWNGSSQESGETLDEYYGVNVTITLRIGNVPTDRRGVVAIRDLRKKAAECRAMLHMSYATINYANAHEEITSANNGFIEPLVFQNALNEQFRGPDWFWAEGMDNAEANVGVSITLSFGNARRVQVVAEQD